MISLGVVVLFVGSCSTEGDALAPESKKAPVVNEKAPAVKPKNDPVARDFSVPTLEGRGMPQIACYLTNGMPRPESKAPTGPQIMILVWPDGRLLYSQNQQQGGPPYFEATIDQARVNAFFSSLQAKGLWTDSRFCNNYPPDSGYVTLFLNRNGRVIKLSSSHDLFEANDKLIQTSRGVQALNGKPLAEVLADQPAGYRHFRKIWDAIRTQSRALVPTEGTTVSPVFTRASVRVLCSWLEMNGEGAQ